MSPPRITTRRRSTTSFCAGAPAAARERAGEELEVFATLVTRSDASWDRARADALKNVDWVSVKRGKKAETDYNAQIEANHDAIRNYYNGLDEAGKIEALKNTYGMVVGGAGGGRI